MGAFRLVFNASSLLAAAVLAFGLAWAGLQTQAPDWQSLALGRLLAEAGNFPSGEAILYTAPAGLRFDGGAWGWDWLGSQLWRLGGESPLLLRRLDAAFLALALLALLAASFRRGARPFSTAVFCAWALLAARPDLAPGPGLAAFGLFCAAQWLLEGPFWPAFFNRWIWLPPLALLAVNLHVGAWALALLALPWLWLADGGAAGAPAQPGLARGALALLLLLCLSLHPQGPLAAAGAWSALAPSPLLPGAFEPRQGALLLLALAWLLLLAAGWTRTGMREARRDRAVLAAFSLLALYSRDALPWALAVAAPLAARRFDQLGAALPAALRVLRWPLKGALLLGLLLWTWHGGLRAVAVAPPEPLPRQSLAFYEEELLDLRILCPPEWTPWLAFRLAPHARFALDRTGRAERGKAASLRRALAAADGWKQALDDNGVEAAWLPRGSALAVALCTAQAWQPVAFDDAAVLYVRALPQQAELIRVNAPRGLRPGDPAHPFEPTRLAESEADLEMRLARDPALGVLYLYQAELWLAKDQEAKARQTLEAGIRADAGFADNYGRLADLRAARGEGADARLLYGKALRRRERADWRESLARLGAR